MLFDETIRNPNIYQIVGKCGIAVAFSGWISQVAHTFYAVAVQGVRHAGIETKLPKLARKPRGAKVSPKGIQTA